MSNPDEVMDVFGEAFMRMVRQRLDLQVGIQGNQITVALYDNGAPEGQGLISAESFRIGVVPPSAPPPPQPPQIVVYRG